MLRFIIAFCASTCLSAYAFSTDFDTEYDAINSIWNGQTVYKRHIEKWNEIAGLSYVVENHERSHFSFSKRKLDATNSLFGSIPSLKIEGIRSYDLSLPDKKFIVISGKGDGLFTVGDWTDFQFIHVLDVTRRWNPVLYSLPTMESMETIVLGVYATSKELNYLRVLPVITRDGEVVEYEVFVYELAKGKSTPLSDSTGKDVAFKVFKTSGGWAILRKEKAEYSMKNDLAERPYYMPINFNK